MRFFRHFKDLGIEGAQAKYYDKISREHRIGEMKEEAKEVAKHIKDEDSVLEVAPGPGYLSIELAKLGKFKITGMDISKDFVAIADSNAKEAGVDVDFLQGNACVCLSMRILSILLFAFYPLRISRNRLSV